MKKVVNLRIPFFILSIAILPWVGTGCFCANAVMEKSNKRTVDLFNPSIVYRQTTNHSHFAFEGTKISPRKEPPVQAYLFIPDYLLIRAGLQTNEDLSLAEVKKLQVKKSENFPSAELALETRLSSDYEKVAELGTNDINIEIKEHHPAAGWALLLPGAFVVDVLGFPVDCYYGFKHAQF